MTEASRREFLKFGGLALVGFGLGPIRWAPGAAAAATTEVIEMRSDALGSRVWFDPIGVHVEPGTTVRWLVRENVHTTTAYHPDNDRHGRHGDPCGSRERRFHAGKRCAGSHGASWSSCVIEVGQARYRRGR